MGMDVGAKKGPRSDINITPLVDVVLVLLIIFKVDEAGVFHVNNETLTDENAVDRLKVWYRAAKSKEATQGPPVIFFDADDKAKYARAMKGLDTIRDSSPGWTIGMMTAKRASATPGTEPTPPGAPPAPGGPPPSPTTPPQ